jgi:serine/threonine protein phosphatase 1
MVETGRAAPGDLGGIAGGGKPPYIPPAMLGRIFGRKVEAVVPRVPAGTRVYAIGDIHGRSDLLREINQLIHEDAYARQAPRNVVIYLGDYVDRGPESREVIDLLLDRKLPGFECLHLMGNHEDIFLRFLADADVGPAWLDYGGGPTLLSYGVRLPDPRSARDLLRAQEELRRAVPERHVRFLRGLPPAHSEGDFFFVHAGVRPGVPLEAQSSQDLIWIRGDFLQSKAEFGKIVVHGHSIRERPEICRNRIGIDTGAFASGTLTCLVLEGEEYAFLHT